MSTLAENFRSAFRTHPAGVSLLSANPFGAPVGLTISSLASLSLDPVAVSFSLTRDSGSAGALLQAPTFVINFLGEHQSHVADAFARSDGARFTEEQGWAYLADGAPYLVDSPVAMRARVHSSLQVGGSRLIAAEVLEVINGTQASHLLYRDRTYLSLDGAQPLVPRDH
ncbi:hypothetical protein GCM10027417_06790 [Glutamicibacter endophyticus]|uniref:flavin reductase family protein n=1 Tax=Glutamicibacter sp. PS TaxID=3075634 RepID=UPI00283CB901|nr:flavin reductase family protein [Glutamicibacter sp. PS]MDR4532588.1 flavin reductase family protein [Glutamicibacter sp. PS]